MWSIATECRHHLIQTKHHSLLLSCELALEHLRYSVPTNIFFSDYRVGENENLDVVRYHSSFNN